MEPVTKLYVSHSRTHSLSSVPDTLKDIQRDPKSTESSQFHKIWATHGLFFPFHHYGKLLSSQKTSDRCLFQCTWQVTKFRLFWTKWNERFCEREACQAPLFSRKGIWTDTTSCWSQLWQHGQGSKKDPHRWLITSNLNFIQRQRSVHANPQVLTLCSPPKMPFLVELPFSATTMLSKTQSSMWPSTLPNGVYHTLNLFKKNRRHLKAKGLFRIMINF